MFSFGVVCHVVGDGVGSVVVDAVYDTGGLYPVRSIDISEQGVVVVCEWVSSHFCVYVSCLIPITLIKSINLR